MAFDLKKKREEVAQTGADLTKPQSGGGGDFAPPAEGITRLRMVGYVETGVHESGGQYKKVKPRAEITFELSGPKHEPKKLDDGKMIPFRVTVKEIVGTHMKNGYIKLFNILNVDGDARNYLDLLMEKAWRGEVSHWKFKGNDGKDRTVAQLKKNGAWSIKPTVYQDEESGETRQVAVPPAISELRVFLWDDGDLDQWDTLLEYQKNKIRSALNFEGSPIYMALIEAKRESELAVTERDNDTPAEEPDSEDDKPAEAPAPAPAAAPKPAGKKAAAAPKAATKPAAKAQAAAPAGDPLQGL